MALANRAPDWDWWRHVPTVALHEAVALSLNIDPKQLRRASTRALMAEDSSTRVPSSNGGWRSRNVASATPCPDR